MLTIILLMMVLGAALKWLAMIKKAPVRVKVRVNENATKLPKCTWEAASFEGA